MTAGGADAVLAASIFHYGEHTVGEAKEYLRRHGVRVRPPSSEPRGLRVGKEAGGAWGREKMRLPVNHEMTLRNDGLGRGGEIR